jgi:ethanolamine utilization protein EutN
MILARVEGNVTSTRKHPSFQGWKLLICQPIQADGKPSGSPIVAIDPHGAGNGDHVVVSSDGSAARAAVGDPKSPVRQIIVAIVDSVDAGKN